MNTIVYLKCARDLPATHAGGMWTSCLLLPIITLLLGHWLKGMPIPQGNSHLQYMLNPNGSHTLPFCHCHTCTTACVYHFISVGKWPIHAPYCTRLRHSQNYDDWWEMQSASESACTPHAPIAYMYKGWQHNGKQWVDINCNTCTMYVSLLKMTYIVPCMHLSQIACRLVHVHVHMYVHSVCDLIYLTSSKIWT